MTASAATEPRPGIAAWPKLAAAPVPYRAHFQLPLPDVLPGLLSGEYEGSSIPLHTHEALFVMLPVTEFMVLGGGAAVPTGPGDIWLSNTLELHGAVGGASHCHARILLLSPELAGEIVAGLREKSPRFGRTLETDSLLAQALAAVWEELERPVKSSHVAGKCRGLLQELLHRVIDQATPPAIGNRADQAIRRVREYLQHHVADAQGLEQLSAVAQVSKSYLVRQFHRAVGLPPHAYHLQLRIARAARLLAHGGSLSRAAYEAGFADQSHLSRRFKAAYGVTPLRYARAVRHPTSAVGVGNQWGQGSGARGFNNGGQDPAWHVG